MGFESGLSQGGEVKKPILKDNVEPYFDEEGKIRPRFIGEPMEGYDEPSERRNMLNKAQSTDDILKVFDTDELITGHDRTYKADYFKELIKGIIDGGDETKLQFLEDIDNVHEAIIKVIRLEKRKKESARARNNFS